MQTKVLCFGVNVTHLIQALKWIMEIQVQFLGALYLNVMH